MARRIPLRANKFLVVLVCTGWSCLFAGCQAEPNLPQHAIESTPEAKFARFEADLHRRCQEASGSMVAEDAGGLGTTSVRTVLDPPTCVLHAPQTPDVKYTAEVTIVTRLVYASSAPVPVSVDEPGRLHRPGEKRRFPTEEESEKNSEPTANLPVWKLGHQEEFRDTYDLVYREDRWTLASRDVPESMLLLLDRALDAQ